MRKKPILIIKTLPVLPAPQTGFFGFIAYSLSRRKHLLLPMRLILIRFIKNKKRNSFITKRAAILLVVHYAPK